MRISRRQWEELVAHAREEAPNECCGYGRVDDGSVGETFRAINERSSPYGYTLDAKSLLAANNLDWDEKQVLVYHSHPKTEPEPSQTDINLAEYPHWLYVIVGLEPEPDVRAFWIRDGRVEEEEIVVE